jgi:hypothetical protein
MSILAKAEQVRQFTGPNTIVDRQVSTVSARAADIPLTGEIYLDRGRGAKLGCAGEPYRNAQTAVELVQHAQTSLNRTEKLAF